MKKQVLNYTVMVKPDERTGTNERCFSVYCPMLDVYSEGDTVEEALENIKGAMELKLQVLAEDKAEVPMEDEEVMVTRAAVTAPFGFRVAM